MTDFLLELRSEEIPARMQAGARAELDKLFHAQLTAAGLSADSVSVWSTPRRLALIATGLPLETAAVREEAKGPRTSAPTQALEGFLRKTGLTRDQLEDRGGVWFAVIERPGRATRDVLAQAIPAIIRSFAWPKSMRWGTASETTSSLRWVRPLSGIVALLGDDLVPCEVDGIASGYDTRGHRFHHQGIITIGNAADYAMKLRAGHVIVDHEERAAIIREGAARVAADAGLDLVADEGLVVENAGLTEWPVPLLGRFAPEFLDVPAEVIQLSARVNQKYFICRDGAGQLANAFVCTANIEARDGGTAIVAGNEKVLAARLSDARFFWEQDRKKPLAVHAEKLANIVFHEKLGTVADKVERVAKLARWLCEEGIIAPLPPAGGVGGGPVGLAASHANEPLTPTLSPEGEREHLAALAEQAARLCKADLVTDMVGEFPELQGLMGGYYAAAEGLDPAVAAAIRDHYKPVGQGDDVPTAPVTVAVSLADKLDSLVGFFGVREVPTGSKDPYALRRAALGVIRLVSTNSIRLPLSKLTASTVGQFVAWAIGGAMSELANSDARALARTGNNPISVTDPRYIAHFLSQPSVKSFVDGFAVVDTLLIPFLADRLKIQQREAGVRHDLIDAVFALGNEDDLVRLLARVKALQAFVATDDGTNLLAGYKRAANLLKQAGAPAQAGNRLRPSDPSPAVGEIAGDGCLPAQGHGSDAMADPAEQQIPQTGEEDPLVLVDTPGMGAVVSDLAAASGDSEATLPERSTTHDIALLGAISVAEGLAAKSVADERFGDAMTALAALRAPIDAFFDSVMVNDPDPALRDFRLGLLGRFRAAVHQVADFSKVEG